MAFEDLEAHLIALGIKPLGERFEPIPPGTWQAIEVETGGAFPDVVRWLFTRFGGSQFEEDPYYFDARYRTEAMFGWFLGAAELADAFESTRETMPRDVVPLANDGGDNFVCVGVGVGNRGAVSFYIHDAPADRRLYPLAGSVEAFLRSLHRAAEDDDEDVRFLVATLATGSTEDRALALRNLAAQPSRDPRVTAEIAALLDERAACLLGMPPRFGELRLLAATALAAERRAAGDPAGVELTCIAPQTATELMDGLRRVGLPWPAGDPIAAGIAAFEQLRARGALAERRVRLPS